MSIDDYNGVRTTIEDQGTPPPSSGVSRDSTFIYGIATKGPVGQPVWASNDTVEELFGEVPTDASFDMSVVRGFYEYVNSSPGKPDVALVRVGDTNASRIDLYENNYITSGDLMYTSPDSSETPGLSMYITAVTEGAEYNGAKVTTTGAESDSFPSYMKIELPDGSTAGFNLGKYAGAPGTVSRVSDLTKLINANTDLSGKIVAGYTPLTKAVTLTILDNSGDITGSIKELVYDLDSETESWGDKIIDITSAYIDSSISLEIDVGSLSAEFDVFPTKVLTGTNTIDEFIRVSSLENILTVTPTYAGQTETERPLYCTKLDDWTTGGTYPVSGDATHDWEFQLHVRRNGSSTNVLLSEYDAITNPTGYSIAGDTGIVTIRETLTLGDNYLASYRYKIVYVEAKLKSDLTSGDDKSYFIFGDQIIFGAEQPANVIAYYDTKVFLESSDIEISSYSNSIIEFTDSSILPDIAKDITLNIRYEPELPGASGKVMGNIIQPGSLSGGKDGRLVSKHEYTSDVKDAFESTDLYPRRHNIVMGMWLDEVTAGYNEETGMAEDLPVNMHADILPYVERASNFTGECDICIPVKPLTSLDQASINAWITNLTESSDTLLNRTANIIDGIQNFRADAPLGVFIGSDSNINNGRRYFMNPACVYTAFKSNLDYMESATHKFVPGNVLDLGVKIFNSEIIGKLNTKRYTTAAVDYQGRFIWADAPTLALRNRSQFDRQFVRDTTYLAVNIAREASEKYIGKPRLPQYLLSLKKDVSKGLEFLVPDVLSDFYVELIPYSDGHITGKTGIRLMLETAKEIRVIDIITTISLSSS